MPRVSSKSHLSRWPVHCNRNFVGFGVRSTFGEAPSLEVFSRVSLNLRKREWKGNAC